MPLGNMAQVVHLLAESTLCCLELETMLDEKHLFEMLKVAVKIGG